MAQHNVSRCWAITKLSIAMGRAHRNKVARCSHAWIRTLGSSVLITTIASCQIEAGNLGSWPNNKNYGEKDEREAYWLNLYPITNHGNYKPQYWVWPLWKPYFHKPRFTIYTIYTIHSINLSASRWFWEVVWWSVNVFSHNFWNSPWNFVPWSVKTPVGALNLLIPNPKMHMLLLHYYNSAMELTPTTWKNVKS